MPTGVALRDARAQLFAAAERVLMRDGVRGLTSRAVTDEAGVSKGVLHRHFAHFDDFVAELVRDRIARLEAEIDALTEAAGSATVVSHLAEALTRIFTPVNLGLVGIMMARDDLRSLLRATTPYGIPILTEAGTGLAAYLDAERRVGRVTADADVRTLALTLIGTGHLLFAGELGALPDSSAVREIVEAITVGAEPGIRP
ncbi:TetR/AcrR family transcriptional regulator [Nonomuraea zeae]|uniref:TetR/AcrR family transcriptional regulator n=1 Tax=Nonomuraea zeae TaxID=1642303 RepID=A0A5S4FJS0_9ACTN|nr:TetR/AcrR family transcriptional regulator [Nonomuraea zeae]TMR20839.1 TetR/AcrR family transcriptional regulator [Nonomuraea zeae]